MRLKRCHCQGSEWHSLPTCQRRGAWGSMGSAEGSLHAIVSAHIFGCFVLFTSRIVLPQANSQLCCSVICGQAFCRRRALSLAEAYFAEGQTCWQTSTPGGARLSFGNKAEGCRGCIPSETARTSQRRICVPKLKKLLQPQCLASTLLLLPDPWTLGRRSPTCRSSPGPDVFAACQACY